MLDEPREVSGFDPAGIQELCKTARTFLEAICLPAAKELGLAWGDAVRVWRMGNFAREVNASRDILGDDTTLQAHPRIVNEVFEHGSWVDDHEVQDWWGGLLASSCTEDGTDDSNLLFTSILGQMTSMQAKLLDHLCRKAQKTDSDGFCVARLQHLSTGEVKEVCQHDELHRIDREIDHIDSMGLLAFRGGLSLGGGPHDLTPSMLAMAFHVRCQGSRLSPVEFFADEIA